MGNIGCERLRRVNRGLRVCGVPIGMGARGVVADFSSSGQVLIGPSLHGPGR